MFMCSLTLISLLLFSQAPPAPPASAPVDPLRVALGTISLDARKGEISAEEVTERHLHLTEQYDEPEQLGRIYAGLADTHCQIGLRDPDTVILYARMALEYPMEPLLRMEVHRTMGGAVRLKNHLEGREKTPEARREAALCFIEAIRVFVEENTPEEMQELPMFSGLRGSGPEYERMKRENEILWKERRRLMAENDLVYHRYLAVGELATTYVEVPDRQQELRALVLEQLQDESIAERAVAALESVLSGKVPPVPRTSKAAAEAAARAED